MKKQAGILILVSHLLVFYAFSQEDSTYNKFVGASFGTASPKTDLEPSYTKASAQVSFFLQSMSNRWLNFGFQLNIGGVQAENRGVRFLDQSEIKINDYAKANYQSLHFEPTLHFLKGINYSLYFAQGFGFMRFSVFDRDKEDLLTQLNSRGQDEEYSRFTVLLPTTLNAYYFLANGFGFQMRAGWLNPQTDYLDNISAFGDPDNNDNIFIFQVAIIKKINLKNAKYE